MSGADRSIVDLRSDTVTRPSPGMRAAMQAAEVGDDCYGEDPTVNALQERVAALLGKEAALFVPTGTMSNQICIRAHTQPGDEVLCEAGSHVYNYEAGAPAVLSGVMCRPIEGRHGILGPEQLSGTIRPLADHQARTRLVCLEHTHNSGGGRLYPIETVRAISAWARAGGLAMHLDGARLWNAVVATGIPAAEWAREFDTVSVCFSKGLGAPVGSMLAGPRDLVDRARRIRRMLGGAMRQAGVMAAAALYALDHNIERLAMDHTNARLIARAAASVSGLRLDPPDVHSNLVWIEVDRAAGPAQRIADVMRSRGVLIHAPGPQRLRLCTHLDVTEDGARRAADAIRAGW
jgi:threonine aldolase